ncbi:unnamed protein product, partial [Ixodes hexagonus]
MDPAAALQLQVQQESTSRSRICTVIAVMACIVMGCFLLLGFSLKRNDELVAILDQYREYLNQQAASSTNAQAAVAAAAALRAREPSQIKRALPRHNASRTDGAQVVYLNAPPVSNFTRRRKMHPSRLTVPPGRNSYREKMGPAIAAADVQQQVESGSESMSPNSTEQVRNGTTTPITHTSTNPTGNASVQLLVSRAAVAGVTNGVDLADGTNFTTSLLRALNGTVHKALTAASQKMTGSDMSQLKATGGLLAEKLSTPLENSEDEIVTDAEEELEGTVIVFTNTSHPSEGTPGTSTVLVTPTS